MVSGSRRVSARCSQADNTDGTRFEGEQSAGGCFLAFVSLSSSSPSLSLASRLLGQKTQNVRHARPRADRCMHACKLLLFPPRSRAPYVRVMHDILMFRVPNFSLCSPVEGMQATRHCFISTALPWPVVSRPVLSCHILWVCPANEQMNESRDRRVYERPNGDCGESGGREARLWNPSELRNHDNDEDALEQAGVGQGRVKGSTVAENARSGT